MGSQGGKMLDEFGRMYIIHDKSCKSYLHDMIFEGAKKMAESDNFYGVVTVGSRGQIVIPAEARTKLQIEEGDKIVVLKGPREGSLIIFKIGAIDIF
jgi:AbrB family looped-hinge helix DNA binding protein